MTRLADPVDGVIGVDTHRDTLAVAATDRVGGTLAQTAAAADLAGYQRLLEFAQAQVPGRRCWAVEGAGSYGAGPTAFLQSHGERVVEIGRPKRPARRTEARATRWTPSGRPGRPWPAITWSPLGGVASGRRCGCCCHPSQRLPGQGRGHQPAQGADRGAPEELRAELRGLGTKRQIARCAVLRERPTRSLEHRMTARALRSTAERIQLLAAEAAGLRAELEGLVAAIAPWLLELPGVGPISAAQI
jgi:transposase